jgi:iron-sulfur cluster assembly accessory protein
MSISLSDNAAKRIATILKDEPEGTMLRVSVDGGGCSGFQYKYDLTTQRIDNDLVIEKLGAIVLIDDISQPFLAESEIDFVTDLMGASFQIKNPNVTASCGCGVSFSL